MKRRRRQSGQSLVLAALLITVLIGFSGLVVDGGEAANEQQVVRSAADGAALAGVYAIGKGSATTAATTLAQQVLVAVPLPVADLTMSYLDAAGSPTVVTASVVTVRAVVADSHRTYFLIVLGIPTLRLTATAEARIGSRGVAAACAVCLMGSTGTTLTEGRAGTMTITGGPLQVNSSGASAVSERTQASITAPSIVVVGGVQQQGNGTITPAPVAGSAIPDPLAAIPVPVVAGVASDVTAPAGASALAPGVYGTVTVNAGSTLTLNPGTFVIRNRLNVNGGTVSGAGVTIFLGCAAYPTACPPNTSGAFITASSGNLTISPPASGTYFGLTVFADRNNIAGDTFSDSTVAVTGTWYSLGQSLTDTTSGDTVSFGQLILGSLSMPNASTFTASRSATNSYGTGPAGGGGLSL